MIKIYVAQYQGISLTSRLIRWYTRFSYSHSAYYDPVKKLVIEAWGGGVQEAKPLDHHTAGTPIELFSLEVTREQKAVIEGFLNRQLGKRYDFPGVFGFVLKNRDRSNKWFCSELVFAAFLMADIPLLKRIEPARVSPGMLGASPLLNFERML